jgi:translation initiation factor 2 subunit 1
MSFWRTEWPETGEFVVATVRRLESYGAYVTLDEYDGKEALLHISEISSRWVRNIRNHVREGQKVVLQVLRVDAAKGQVDLSLRRVNRDDKRKKLEQWKKSRKAESLMKAAAASLKTTPEKIYSAVWQAVVDKYGTLYDGLEAAAKKGAGALTEAGVNARTAEALTQIARDKIVVKGVTVQGVFEVTAMGNRGVEEIRGLFQGTKRVGDENEVDTNVYTLGAPKYRIEVAAEDYKKAEVALDRIVKFAEGEWAGHEGTIVFNRE